MLTKKEYKFLIILYSVFLLIYTFIFYGKIEYFYIIFITLATGSFFKGLYDIKNKTGNQDVYIYDKVSNQKMRYSSLFISFVYLCLSIYMIWMRI